MVVTFTHPSGITRQIKVGFSWTHFFFGAIPFLFRSQWKLFFIWVGITIVLFFFTFVPALIPSIVLCFIGNKLSAKDLLLSGYKPTDDAAWQSAKVEWGVADPLPNQVS